jgi:hypothetical protein
VTTNKEKCAYEEEHEMESVNLDSISSSVERSGEQKVVYGGNPMQYSSVKLGNMKRGEYSTINHQRFKDPKNVH